MRLIYLLLLGVSWFSHASTIQYVDLPIGEVKQLARQQNKPVFINFTADWCSPCRIMEQEVLADPDLGAYINETFIPVRIDDSEKPSALSLQMEITAYPSHAFLEATGQLLTIHEGAVNKEQFGKLTYDMANFRTMRQEWLNNREDPYTVHRYTRALQWMYPEKADRILTSYFREVPKKKWDKPENWKILYELNFAPHWMMEEVVNNNTYKENYEQEYCLYLQAGLDKLLQKSMELQNEYRFNQYIDLLSACRACVEDIRQSTLKAGLLFYEKVNPEVFNKLFMEYTNRLPVAEKAQMLAATSYKWSEEYFNRDRLNMSITWAKESIKSEENFTAYQALAQAYYRLNDYRNAYAYALLARSLAPEESHDDLNQFMEMLDVLYKKDMTSGVTTSSADLPGQDGRFTLGAGKKRLMYGYPIPTSTSHFVIRVNDSLATNASHLNMTKLKGAMFFMSNASTPEIRVEYQYQGVLITQRLVPVDKAFKPIDGGYAQYYRISYTIDNLDSKAKKIGIGLLIDTMIDDNDNCVVAADNSIIRTEYGFRGDYIPERLQLFRTEGDTSDMMGEAVLMGNGATRPDKVVVGRWPVLHKVSWKLNPAKVRYHDSAYFLKWEDRPLKPKGSMEFVTYYGLPAHKKPELRILMEDKTSRSITETVYFENDSHQPDLNARMKIDKLLTRSDIDIIGVILKGYADVTGESNYNFELSERRIANVGRIIKAYQLNYVPKPYGSRKSSISEMHQLYGYIEDRKVEVEVFYRPRVETPELVSRQEDQ